MIGTEIQAARKTALYAYYSEAHADRAVTTDVDGSVIGSGVAGSTTANERIGEATAGVTQTLFRAILAAAAGALVAQEHAGPHWGYGGSAGPDHWGDLDKAFSA